MTSEEIIQKQIEYYNNHDIEGFVSTYSKDIKIFNQGDTCPETSGTDALYKQYLKTFSTPDLHAEIENRMVLGNFVIDFEHVTGTNGNTIAKGIVIYQVEDELIKNVWFII